MDELLGKVNDLRGSMKRKEEEEKTDSVASLVVRIVLIVGLCVLVVGTIYAIMQYLKPRYLDEYDDDFDLDDDFFEALKKCKKENYALIYKKDELNAVIKEQIYPMMDMLYERFRNDLINKDESSAVYKHHIAYIAQMAKFTHNRVDYAGLPTDDIVVDYIASMTDDYLVDLFAFLYPDDKHHVEYRGYFEDLKN